MTLFSFIALALGMAAATADRVSRPNVVALVAVARATRAARKRVEARTAVRRSFPPAPPVRIAAPRPLRRLTSPLRGATAARAPGC